MRALTLSPGSVVVSADSMAPGTTTPSAIILAAGEGRRLGGRAKASLRIDGSSLLQRLGSALRAAGVHELGVVIGPYRDQLLPLARACDAQVLQHPQAGATLIDSQRLALDHHLAQQGDADLLLVLADLPFLTATHIEALLERWRQRAHGVDAQMPLVAGVRGHPLILSRRAVEAIAATARELGIRDWLARHPERILTVNASQPAYVRDIDTAADIEALRAALAPHSVSWPDTTLTADQDGAGPAPAAEDKPA